MSIEKLDFTAGSQVYSYKPLQNHLADALFFVFCPAIFEVAPPLILGKQKAEIAPGP